MIRTNVTERTQVLKFGSSVLRSEADLPAVVASIYRRFRQGVPAAAVISAFRGRTDALISLADRTGEASTSRYALLGIGELEAAAAVAIALERVGLPARLVQPHELGIIAEGDPAEAEPIRIDPTAIREAIDCGAIPVIPGFIARNVEGQPVVMGRGGSDLTAISLAQALGADAVLIKDTGGVYEWDPAEQGPPPRRFDQIAFDDALALGDRVIQPRATDFARRKGTPFVVSGLGSAPSTLVHGGPTSLVGKRASGTSPRASPVGGGPPGAPWPGLRRRTRRDAGARAARRAPRRTRRTGGARGRGAAS